MPQRVFANGHVVLKSCGVFRASAYGQRGGKSHTPTGERHFTPLQGWLNAPGPAGFFLIFLLNYWY